MSEQRRIEIQFNGSTWYAYPKDDWTDAQVNNAIAAFEKQFRQPTYPPVEHIEWIWCLVGNVVVDGMWNETRKLIKGTKPFSGGTRVYCYPLQWADGYKRVKVIGKPRSGDGLFTLVMRPSAITNWQLKKVFHPQIITLMLSSGKGWSNTDESKAEIETLLTMLTTTG